MLAGCLLFVDCCPLVVCCLLMFVCLLSLKCLVHVVYRLVCVVCVFYVVRCLLQVTHFCMECLACRLLSADVCWSLFAIVWCLLILCDCVGRLLFVCCP